LRLSRLLEAIEYETAAVGLDREISRIAFDSRQCGPESLFVAIPGTRMDGHKYVAEAIARGAAAVVAQEEVNSGGAALIRVKNSRKALACLGERFYGYPARKLKVIGVTGTNGKTTTTHMIASVLEAHGMKTGIMGTLYSKVGDEIIPARVTTPESVEIQEILARMVDAGLEGVAMEVSSHALHFDRVAGIKFDGAVFTNLTQDHLDFHGNLDDYFAEKMKLFSRLKTAGEGGFAVLNGDDPRTPAIESTLSVPCKTYGLGGNSWIVAEDITSTCHGISFTAREGSVSVPVKMSMAGMFNVYNALAAVGVGLFMDASPRVISMGLGDMKPVKGRFQMVSLGQPFGVAVDYAHTPDGLANVLSSARELAKGRLIVVFGCGGDRDRTKRPLMGQIAGELSDLAIITSDNPRTEEPEAIINDILPGMVKSGGSYRVQADRKKAIFEAIGEAREGDLMVIAGKGHEDYQILQDKTIHFDDWEVASQAIESVLERNSHKV
jgi:UDP-N-acetylmuramoyl-L-alanyl-D-glutamate--2,6-diaminopimelate ligase